MNPLVTVNIFDKHLIKMIVPLILIVFLGIATGEISQTVKPPSSSVPSYQPDQSAAYIPHSTYPYDTYGSNSAYEGYLVPAAANQYPSQIAAPGVLALTLRAFAKAGLFFLGGVAVLVVGGIFTTAVCSLTPICTISFTGLGGINKEAVRSFINPDNVSTAAAFVQNAITKYQRMQRSPNGS